MDIAYLNKRIAEGHAVDLASTFSTAAHYKIDLGDEKVFMKKYNAKESKTCEGAKEPKAYFGHVYSLPATLNIYTPSGKSETFTETVILPLPETSFVTGLPFLTTLKVSPAIMQDLLNLTLIIKSHLHKAQFQDKQIQLAI